MIRIPENRLSKTKSILLKHAYELLDNFIGSVDNTGNLIDDNVSYSIIKCFSIIRVVSEVKGRLTDKQIKKIVSTLNEVEDFILNLVLLRNALAHPFDMYAEYGEFDSERYEKARSLLLVSMGRYYNYFRNK